MFIKIFHKSGISKGTPTRYTVYRVDTTKEDQNLSIVYPSLNHNVKLHIYVHPLRKYLLQILEDGSHITND